MIIAIAAVWFGAQAAAPLLAADLKSEFPKTLKATASAIVKRIGGTLDVPQDLFRYQEFIRLYEHPERYLNEALECLRAKDVSDEEKVFVTYAMQRLKRKKYLAFLETLLELRTSGVISDDVYTNGVFPHPEWNTTLQVNYRDAKVKAFLKKARAANTSPEDNTYIDCILSGDALKKVEAMREAEQLPPGR